MNPVFRDMPLYKPICDRIEVVRPADQLASVVADLVKSRL